MLDVMDNDPRLHEISEEDGRPATKGDIAELARIVATTTAHKEDIQHLEERMDGFEQRMDTFEQRMERFESSQAAILDVVRSIDRQLQTHKTLPPRVERLERTVFRS